MAFCELKEKKKRILPLFPSSDHHVTIEAVIEGTCEGKILVDDTKTPKTAAVWTAPVSEAVVYLGGVHNNTVFNQQLWEYFDDVIKPESIRQGLDAYQFYPTPQWETMLIKVDSIFKDRDSYYRLDPVKFKSLQSNWKENIPDGFSLNAVESEDVFEKAQNVPVFGELNSWKSFKTFQEHGFGYYLVEDNTDKVVSGCLTKVVAAGSRRCEVAIGTDGTYIRRGFATAVACATVEEALKRGLEVIWECFHGNTASINTNQKLGFDYICDEPFYFGFLYESLENLLFAGYHYVIELKDPHKAAEWFQKAVVQSKAENRFIPPGYNFYAACAFAAVKEYDMAVQRLRESVDKLQDPKKFYDRLQAESAFDELRNLKEFKEVLRSIENLIEG
jgi:hypothetical protein